MKTAWCWQKNGHIHQNNRIYSLEIDQYKYNQQTSEKEAKVIQWRNVKCKCGKLLKENIGENLGDLGFGNEFLDR